MKRGYKIILNYIVGPVLFLVLAIIIYTKIKNQSGPEETRELFRHAFSPGNTWRIIALFLLMFANRGIEARKWQILVSSVQKVSFLKAYKAVLSGVSLSLFLPSGIGEYFGRIVYLEEGNRLRSVPIMIAGSMSQLIITLFAGLAGLLYLKNYVWSGVNELQGVSVLWVNSIIYITGISSVAMLFIYFKLSWLTTLSEKIPLIYKYRYFITSLEDFRRKELTRILVLSMIRYVVFIMQYLLMLHIFNVQISWFDASCATAVIFLVMAILPTIPVADLGIRGVAALEIFGLLSTNSLGIGYTSAGIWFVNLIIPAIIGSLFILGIKIFRNR